MAENADSRENKTGRECERELGRDRVAESWESILAQAGTMYSNQDMEATLGGHRYKNGQRRHGMIHIGGNVISATQERI